MSNNTDQIRNLKNVRHIAGRLAELGPLNKGVGTDGINYIRFDGRIQYGENDYEVAPFRVFIKEKQRNGEDSEQYENALNWYNEAIPMTKDKENATWADLGGSVTSNLWVGSDGKLNEGTVNSIRFFNDFRNYVNQWDVEGYIVGVNENEDGKCQMRFVTRDMFGNCIDFNPILVSDDLVDSLEEAGYEKGRTAELIIEWVSDVTTTKPKRKSYGRVNIQTERIRTFPMVVGGFPALEEDDDDALTRAQIKGLLAVYEEQKEEKKNEGYQGKKGTKSASKSTNTSKATNTFKTAKVTSSKPPQLEDEEEEDDDDLPF